MMMVHWRSRFGWFTESAFYASSHAALLNSSDRHLVRPLRGPSLRTVSVGSYPCADLISIHFRAYQSAIRAGTARPKMPVRPGRGEGKSER